MPELSLLGEMHRKINQVVDGIRRDLHDNAQRLLDDGDLEGDDNFHLLVNVRARAEEVVRGRQSGAIACLDCVSFDERVRCVGQPCPAHGGDIPSLPAPPTEGVYIVGKFDECDSADDSCREGDCEHVESEWNVVGVFKSDAEARYHAIKHDAFFQGPFPIGPLAPSTSIPLYWPVREEALKRQMAEARERAEHERLASEATESVRRTLTNDDAGMVEAAALLAACTPFTVKRTWEVLKDACAATSGPWPMLTQQTKLALAVLESDYGITGDLARSHVFTYEPSYVGLPTVSGWPLIAEDRRRALFELIAARCGQAVRKP